MHHSSSNLVSDNPYIVSIFPLNNVLQNRRIVNLESPMLIGRLLDRDDPSQTNNLKFASKVVSRQHAIMGFIDGKLYVQDTKSSSGTFLNSKRLSAQGQESPKVEVHDGDVIQLGEDCEVNGVMHQSVLFRVILGNAGLRDRLGSGGSTFEATRLEDADGPSDQYIDFSLDPQVQANVDAEFNFIWSSLTQGIDHPLKRLRQAANPKPGSSSKVPTLVATPLIQAHQSSAQLRQASSNGRRPSMSRENTAVVDESGVGLQTRDRAQSTTSTSSGGTAVLLTTTSLSYSSMHSQIPATPATAFPPTSLPWTRWSSGSEASESTMQK